LQAWRLELKKPKRRRTTLPRKQVRMVTPPGVSASENDVGEMLAGMMRARLALMPPQVAAEYRDLAERDDLTVAEKAKVNVLEDTYSPSRPQIQAAISAAHAGMTRNRKAAR
jgi:hypothetical protein